MPFRISVNNLWIADLAIFRDWINNDQRVTTTPRGVIFTRSRFLARSTIPEEKWGLLVFYPRHFAPR